MAAQLVAKYDNHMSIKSRNMTQTSLDLVIELRTSQGGPLVQEIMRLSGVNSASLISHDGEVNY